mgnify:CR=1 FL=1
MHEWFEQMLGFVASALGLIAVPDAAALGVAIALWVKLEAAQAVLTITMMVLAIVGGMFFPSQFFPEWLQTIGHFTPTWWIVALGQWPFLGGDFPITGVLVLGIWLAILSVVASLGFRRAVRTSKR